MKEPESATKRQGLSVLFNLDSYSDMSTVRPHVAISLGGQRAFHLPKWNDTARSYRISSSRIRVSVTDQESIIQHSFRYLRCHGGMGANGILLWFSNQVCQEGFVMKTGESFAMLICFQFTCKP